MGKLIFTYSTMKAGKSLDLIRVHYNYANDTKVKIAVLKPETDTRDSGFIRSRTGSEVPVTFTIKKDEKISKLKSIFDYDVILVDEAQFLTKQQVKELNNLAVNFNKIIMTWGLRIDYQGNGFEGSQALFTYANEIREIKTVCGCGKKATHHLLYSDGKLVTDGSQIVIGDTEYRSVCGKCFYVSVSSKLIQHDKANVHSVWERYEYVDNRHG